MTTLEPLLAQLPPLRTDTDGTVRVGASRVTLDTVIYAYETGASPEEIWLRFPSLLLPDIYATISYYLQHRAVVDAYLNERRVQAEEIRRNIEVVCPPGDLRAKLLARRKTKR